MVCYREMMKKPVLTRTMRKKTERKECIFVILKRQGVGENRPDFNTWIFLRKCKPSKHNLFMTVLSSGIASAQSAPVFHSCEEFCGE